MDTPSTPLPRTDAAAQQLARWQELRTQLQELHAKLEYLRLMLRMEDAR
jgi:hypothetical protein